MWMIHGSLFFLLYLNAGVLLYLFHCFSSCDRPRIWMSHMEFKFNKNTFLTYVLFLFFFLLCFIFMIFVIRLDRINQFICILFLMIPYQCRTVYCTYILYIVYFVIRSVCFVRVCGWWFEMTHLISVLKQQNTQLHFTIHMMTSVR